MWLLQSTAKHTSYRPSSNEQEWGIQVERWVKDAQADPDDAWLSASIVHLLGVIASVEPSFLQHLESNGLKTSVLRDRVIAQLRLKVNDHRSSYVSYCCTKRLPLLIRQQAWT